MATFTQDGVVYEDLGDGNVRVVGYEAAAAPSTVVPPNPVRAAREQQEADRRAAADAAAAADRDTDNRRQDAQEAREQREWDAKFFPDGTPRPVSAPLTNQQRGAARLKLQGVDAIANQVARVEAALEEAEKGGFVGPLWGNVPFSGSLDAESSVLDKSIAQLAPLIRQLTRTPGEGAMSDYESRLAATALPARSDNPAALRESLEGIKALLTQSRLGYAEMLGDAVSAEPEQRAEPEVDPVTGATRADLNTPDDPGDLPPANGPDGNEPTPPPQTGASGRFRYEHDPRMSAQIDALINARADEATINTVLKQQGFPPLELGSVAVARRWMDENPGQSYFGAIANREIPLNPLQQFAGSPTGAFLANAANFGAAGIPAAMAGDRGKGALDAMEVMNPTASMLGNITGGITGAIGAEAALAGRMAGTGLARFAPRAADALYGATLGFNEAEEGQGASGATVGALTGIAGGFLGDKAMRGVGAVARGVTNPAAQYLRSRGVPLTGGQIAGGNLQRIEDALTSVPFVGGQVNARRGEGLEAAVRAAFDETGDMVGQRPDVLGREGIDALKSAVEPMYDAATAGYQIPFDDQFPVDLDEATARAQNLPDDLRNKFAMALQNRVTPVTDMGVITGEGYQQAVRGLKGYRAEHTKPGFEQDYRDSLGGVIGALRGQMERGGGEEVVSGLGAADNAYRHIKTLDAAVKAAKNGSSTGQIGLPSMAQLNTAAQRTADKFGGERPFAQLIDAGQQVLPSRIPDSGTAARLMVGGALTGGTLTGGGLGYAAGDTPGAGMGSLATALALMAGGTKTGQRALAKALLDRPEWLRTAGTAIQNRAQLGGGFGAGILTPLLVGP